MISLYNVVSLDGFIADEKGKEDFIPDSFWSGTLKFFNKYDTLVMGKNSYEAIQNYDPQLLEAFERLKIKKVVVTGNNNFKPREGYLIAESPEKALAMGSNVLVSSGPTLNNYLLKNNLVNQIFFKEVSVKLGKGIFPFTTDIKNIPVTFL